MADERSRASSASESPYKIIGGVKYDQRLLELVEKFAADGQVGYPEAKKLWTAALDGDKATVIGHATLKYIMEKNKFTDKATNYLKTFMEAGTDASPFKIVDGRRYDRKLLEAAQKYAADGQISVAEAKNLWAAAEDGKRITEIEKVTLKHVLETAKLTAPAKAFLEGKLASEKTEGDAYYKIIDGMKYDRDLLELVEKFAADGQVGYPEAKKVWAAALDGDKVTDIERATLKYAMEKYKFTDMAANFLKTFMEAGTDSASFKVIDGKRYDRQLLEEAQKYAADGQISFPEAQALLLAAGGTSVTGMEKDTLEYILKNLKVTNKAKEHMEKQLKVAQQKAAAAAATAKKLQDRKDAQKAAAVSKESAKLAAVDAKILEGIAFDAFKAAQTAASTSGMSLQDTAATSTIAAGRAALSASLTENTARDLFDRIDTDHDGFISRAEWDAALQSNLFEEIASHLTQSAEAACAAASKAAAETMSAAGKTKERVAAEAAEAAQTAATLLEMQPEQVAEAAAAAKRAAGVVALATRPAKRQRTDA